MLTPADLATRRNYIGASEVAAIMGLSPFRRDGTPETAATVFWRKRPDLLGELAPEEYKPTKPQERGDYLEYGLMRKAQDDFPEYTIDHQHVAIGPCGILRATLDGLLVGTKQGVEAKSPGKFEDWGDADSDEIPLPYVLQCQAQMYCAGLDLVWVYCLVPSWRSSEIRRYRIDRDEDIIGAIVTRCHAFWREHVEAGVPPEGGETAPLYLLKRVCRITGKRIDLDDAGRAAVAEWDAIREQRLAVEKAEETAKARVMQAMGDAEWAPWGDGKIIRVQSVSARRIDTEELRKRHPDVAEECTRVTTSPKLGIVKRPKGLG